jgi:hypothetical protein
MTASLGGRGRSSSGCLRRRAVRTSLFLHAPRSPTPSSARPAASAPLRTSHSSAPLEPGFVGASPFRPPLRPVGAHPPPNGLRWAADILRCLHAVREMGEAPSNISDLQGSFQVWAGKDAGQCGTAVRETRARRGCRGGLGFIGTTRRRVVAVSAFSRSQMGRDGSTTSAAQTSPCHTSDPPSSGSIGFEPRPPSLTARAVFARWDGGPSGDGRADRRVGVGL